MKEYCAQGDMWRNNENNWIIIVEDSWKEKLLDYTCRLDVNQFIWKEFMLFIM